MEISIPLKSYSVQVFINENCYVCSNMKKTFYVKIVEDLIFLFPLKDNDICKKCLSGRKNAY
jgi:hypothetical protein